MLQTPFPPGVPTRSPARRGDRFEPGAVPRHFAMAPTAAAVASLSTATGSSPMPQWREISWVGFGGGNGDPLSGKVPPPIASGATEAPTPRSNGTNCGVMQPPEAVAAKIGPAGPPAVTEREARIGREARRRTATVPAIVGGALLVLLRRAQAGSGRLLRSAGVAASMGVVAVFAYHAGEHLAGLAGFTTSAAAPGDPARAGEPERGPAAAVALAAALSRGAAVKPPEGLSGPAAHYLERAKAGDAAAQFNIAALYARGDGVAQDFAGAAQWFREAAEGGSRAAQFNLAVMYEGGLGVVQNAAEAISWYRRAAEHNYPPAQYNLALAYAEGRGLPQDMVAASHWYHLAASRGSVPAMVNLAILYETGEGVERSLADAYAWYRAAARGRDDAAAHRAREVFQQFTGAEKGKAILAAAVVVDTINQPLAKPQPAGPAPANEPAAVGPAAAPAETGGSAITLKPGGPLNRSMLEAKRARPRPNG